MASRLSVVCEGYRSRKREGKLSAPEDLVAMAMESAGQRELRAPLQ